MGTTTTKFVVKRGASDVSTHDTEIQAIGAADNQFNPDRLAAMTDPATGPIEVSIWRRTVTDDLLHVQKAGKGL